MRPWQPWFGLSSAVGLGVMLLGEGWLDALGFAVAVAPLAHGAVALWRHRPGSAEQAPPRC